MNNEDAQADIPTTLDREQIVALCRRAFGSGIDLIDVRTLAGGTFNETHLVNPGRNPFMVATRDRVARFLSWYSRRAELINLSDGSRTILRVAPPATGEVYWDVALSEFTAIFDILAVKASILDEIRQPHLLHGDR